MKPLSWSYSSLTDFEGCPRRYQVVRVLKRIPFKDTEATLYGKDVHKALELRVKDKTPLPNKYAEYEGVASRFDKPNVFTEQQIALTRNLVPCDWWAKDVWVRGVIDVGVKAGPVALLADYKTGKMKSDSDQLALFAALKFAEDPEVNHVKTKFIWLKEKKTTGEEYYRDATASIWNTFMGRVQRLEQAYEKDKWIPRPSGLCRSYCPVGKQNCEFCGTD